jgi:hypothetical protein
MKRFWPFVLVLVLLAALAGAWPAYAAGCGDDHAVIADSYTLAAGQVLDSNLIVLGGQATVAPGAVVNCKVVVLGGSLDLSGKVLQDVVVMGGDVHLHSASEIDGELQSLGGTFTQDAGAVIRGGVSQGFNTNNDGGSGNPLPDAGFSVVNAALGFYHRVSETILGALGIGLVALLVVLIWPEPTARVRAAVQNAPGPSGVLGLLTAIAVPVLIFVAMVTVCLIPVGFMAGVVLTAAIAFGWIAVGELVGQKLVSALNISHLSPAVAAGIGTALLSLAVSVTSWFPCVGWVVPLVVSSVGLGAVTLTRFGTQPYLPSSGPALPAVSAGT